MSTTVVLIPGDGIGPEITAATLRVLEAAGAEIVYGPQYAQLSYHEQQGDFNGFLASMKREGLRPNGFNLFSAHQMSSCRIGGSPSQGVVNPEGETYEVQNLYVADSSIFPTAVGVNPMLAIMAAAHLIAQGIKGKF